MVRLLAAHRALGIAPELDLAEAQSSASSSGAARFRGYAHPDQELVASVA